MTKISGLKGFFCGSSSTSSTGRLIKLTEANTIYQNAAYLVPKERTEEFNKDFDFIPVATNYNLITKDAKNSAAGICFVLEVSSAAPTFKVNVPFIDHIDILAVPYLAPELLSACKIGLSEQQYATLMKWFDFTKNHVSSDEKRVAPAQK